MNRFIVVVLCFLVTLAKAIDKEGAKEMMRGLSDECKEKVGATNDDVEAMLQHEMNPSQNGKCLKACLMQKFEMLSDDGKLIEQGMIELAKVVSENNEDMVKIATEIAAKCVKEEVPADPCESVMIYDKCMYEEIKARGIDDGMF